MMRSIFAFPCLHFLLLGFHVADVTLRQDIILYTVRTFFDNKTCKIEELINDENEMLAALLNIYAIVS